MKNSGYYEIVHHMEALTGLKMRAMAGNVQFNRLHWHDSLEIMCCIYGSFSMRFPDTIVHLTEGDLITIEGGVPHEIIDGTPDGLQLIFSADASLLRLQKGECYTLSTVGTSPLPTDHPDIQSVRRSIARLICLLPPESDSQWYDLHLELYRILSVLSRHKSSSSARQQPTGQFARFLQCVDIIHRDYKKPLSAAALASEIGFSEPTVYRLFQSHMGLSFTEYLNSVRISAACGLLERSSSPGEISDGIAVPLSMTELAAECGFSSLSNFYRAFHQFTGMSPREYRKNLSTNKSRTSRSDSALTGSDQEACRAFAGRPGMQHELLRLNRFQPLPELPESYPADIRHLAGFDS